ncbi:hypothetical protein DH2020_007405 [Rehmannia glutinosa]|uniref:Uncharacterized protein n=1 Tax=Rehmannia glutinosa TaxID=99300 RepID=A0ABR0TYW6_REHGL
MNSLRERAEQSEGLVAQHLRTTEHCNAVTHENEETLDGAFETMAQMHGQLEALQQQIEAQKGQIVLNQASIIHRTQLLRNRVLEAINIVSVVAPRPKTEAEVEPEENPEEDPNEEHKDPNMVVDIEGDSDDDARNTVMD